MISREFLMTSVAAWPQYQRGACRFTGGPHIVIGRGLTYDGWNDYSMPESGRSAMKYGMRTVFAAVLIMAVWLGLAAAQQGAAQAPPAQGTVPAQSAPVPAAPPAPPASPNAPETSTREEPATFKTRVNLVSVPVVV